MMLKPNTIRNNGTNTPTLNGVWPDMTPSPMRRRKTAQKLCQTIMNIDTDSTSFICTDATEPLTESEILTLINGRKELE